MTSTSRSAGKPVKKRRRIVDEELVVWLMQHSSSTERMSLRAAGQLLEANGRGVARTRMEMAMKEVNVRLGKRPLAGSARARAASAAGQSRDVAVTVLFGAREAWAGAVQQNSFS